jgi:hypothetical protein
MTASTTTDKQLRISTWFAVSLTIAHGAPIWTARVAGEGLRASVKRELIFDREPNRPARGN